MGLDVGVPVKEVDCDEQQGENDPAGFVDLGDGVHLNAIPAGRTALPQSVVIPSPIRLLSLVFLGLDLEGGRVRFPPAQVVLHAEDLLRVHLIA